MNAATDLLADEAMSLAEAMTLALAHAARGVHVFPVALSWDPTKYDGRGGINKRPLNDHGHKDATTEAREVRRQFNKAKLRPGEVYGVGWWPGGTGRHLVDVDDKGDVCGSDELAALEAEHGPLPDTVRLTTPSGGAHIVLGSGGRRIGNDPLAPGIDIRADDGWGVLAGTRSPWGEWAWDGGVGLIDGGTVADAPTWLLDRLAPATRNGTNTTGHWRQVDETRLHPADLAALHALRALGGHGEFIPPGKDYVAITRPGKRAGASATIGHIAPGVVKMFSSHWPRLNAKGGTLENGVYDADELAALAGVVEPDGGPVDDDEDLDTFEPIDLRPAYRGDKTRPPAEVFLRDDGVALLVPGLDGLFGDSGDGKSLLLLLAVIEEIRAGHPPIWVTYEDANEDLIVERLKLLGATENEVAQLRFMAPQVGLSAGVERIAHLADEAGARLVVVDSMGEAMAVGGVNEDKDNEVGPWFRQTLRRLHDLRPALAILPIDHSTKAKDNPLFPSGSKRKRAAVTGRAYLLNVRSPFGIGAVGHVQLVVAKDRGGRFRRGDIAAEITLDASTTPYTWTISAPRDGDSYLLKMRRRRADERVLEVLGEATMPMTAEEAARLVNDPRLVQAGEGRVAISTVQNALTALSRCGEVTKSGGERVDGKPTLAKWILTRPDQDETQAVKE